MNDILKERLWRQIEALPEEQLYQALDYVEFLTSKYARGGVRPAGSALQQFGEKLEDRLRLNRVGYDAIRGTMNVVGAADRMMSGLAEAGRSILREVVPPVEPEAGRPTQISPPTPPAAQPAPRRRDIVVDE